MAETNLHSPSAFNHSHLMVQQYPWERFSIFPKDTSCWMYWAGIEPPTFQSIDDHIPPESSLGWATIWPKAGPRNSTQIWESHAVFHHDAQCLSLTRGYMWHFTEASETNQHEYIIKQTLQSKQKSGASKCLRLIHHQPLHLHWLVVRATRLNALLFHKDLRTRQP